ncbi:transcriptional regulator [Sporomusaceae bacterium FL31]|nr:transcriptional regulator [Sporomusaceae bacterium FL31]GCE33694.1 transcriptional regulator [Sporomusaceae bacterium]
MENKIFDALDLAEIIKSLRENRSWSQRQLATIAGISNTEINRIESGERKQPSLMVLFQLSKAFEVPVDLLINACGVKLVNPLAQSEKISLRKIQVVSTIRVSTSGLAYEEDLGVEYTDPRVLNDYAAYIWFKISGDSMIGECIRENDLALVRIQPEVVSGSLAIVVINEEPATLKRVYKIDGYLIFHSANPNYPPRIFHGKQLKTIHIVGLVKEIKRKF